MQFSPSWPPSGSARFLPAELMGDNGEVSSWSAPVANHPVDSTVSIPGSKSLTNRALVLSALAVAPSRLSGVLRSRDTDLMIGALSALGTRITPLSPEGTTELLVEPAPLTGAAIDCGLAGTVMRFVPPLAALAYGESRFDGDPVARTRPQATVLSALRELGATVTGDRLPFTVSGTGALAGGRVEMDASASSQFVSGILLSAARFEQGVELVHVGEKPVPSGPHIEMTLNLLHQAGVTASTPATGVWQISPGPISAVDWIIEPDLSNATPFLAAAAATGGTVRIPHWPLRTTQPGDSIRAILEQMGATVRLDTASSQDSSTATLIVVGPSQLNPVDLDLSAVGELTPTIAALCALASGPSRLYGIAHLRGHETDRLAALAAELGKVGCVVEDTEDSLEISPAPLRGAKWCSYADHRMATAGAILGLATPGIEIDDIDCTSKTLPGFATMWNQMLDPRG